MNLVSTEHPGRGARASALAEVTASFPVPEAFAVLRAWRAWAEHEGDGRRSGFLLLRPSASGAADSSLVLTSESLGAKQLAAIGRYSHRRPRSLVAPAGAAPTPPVRVPSFVAPLRALDDWAIEMFLRSGAQLCRSLVIGVRHCRGRFELVSWARPDALDAVAATSALTRALASWINH